MVFFIQILPYFPPLKPTPKMQSWIIQRGRFIPLGFNGRHSEHDFIMSRRVTNSSLSGRARVLRCHRVSDDPNGVVFSSGSLRLAVIIGVAVGAFLALIVLIGTLGAFCCARLQRSKWAACFKWDRHTETSHPARPLRLSLEWHHTCNTTAVLGSDQNSDTNNLKQSAFYHLFGRFS